MTQLPGAFNDSKQIHRRGSNSLCSIGPTGIYNKLLIHNSIQGRGHDELIALSHGIRWQLPLGQVILYSDGHNAYLYPGLKTSAMPEALVQASSVELHNDGIIADKQLFRWR
jgi:hypothetical protein